MQAVDFSSKHNILIRHKDGTLTPMDEPYYETKLIAPGTWQIMSSGDYHYLVEGDEEAIAIDTGYGAGNLREYLESLCGKPVRKCINTHYHFDHSANNCYFDLVYMAEEDVDRASVPYPSFEGIDFPRDYPVEIVAENSVIPLKGRPLEIFKIGDHTPGGIAILDRKERLLFSGDEIMPGGKMMRSAEKFALDMAKLKSHRSEFDRICGGPEMLDGEEVDIFYKASQLILRGERSAAPDRHSPSKRLIQEENGITIYDCQHPHPEDVGPKRTSKESDQPPKGPMGWLKYRDRRFMFPEFLTESERK